MPRRPARVSCCSARIVACVAGPTASEHSRTAPGGIPAGPVSAPTGELTTPLRRMADSAVAGGVRYLLSGQDEDGFWRDYDLRAGSSDSWTTAWVGWCLTSLDRHRN